MKKFLKITILWLLFIGNSYAIENWEIKKVIDNKYIEISTEGLNVKGDKYMLHMKINGKCDTIEDGYTFYTTKNNPGVTLLPGKKIKLESLGLTIVSEIKAVVPVFDSHHLVWITNGLYEFEGHTNFISQSEKTLI